MHCYSHECSNCKPTKKERAESHHLGYSIRGYQSSKNCSNSKGVTNVQRSSVGAFHDPNQNDVEKDDHFSFRELAKNLLFVNEQDDRYSNSYDRKAKYGIYKSSPASKQSSQEQTECCDKKYEPKILQNNITVVNDQGNAKNYHLEKWQDFKIVAITNIPKKLSVPSLLHQIHGGPLEKIELVKRDDYQFYNDEKLYAFNRPINWDEVSIFLHFNRYEDARNFYLYSKTEFFRVNDIHLKTLWIPDLDDDLEDYKTLENNLLVANLMKGEEKARRVLVFKKPLYEKKSKHCIKRRLGHLDPTANYSEDFDVEEIKKDFGQYGRLVEILPVVSRKLCFGIQYYDVRSAIKVKRIIQSNGHGNREIEELEAKDEYDIFTARDIELRNKYQHWYVWYGKDPTDKSVAC